MTTVEPLKLKEPHATIMLWEEDGDKKRLNVYSATQGISNTRDALAKLFGLKPEQVRAICPFVGGGFGCKGNTWPHVALARVAASVVGRPVKLVLDRRQMFTSNGYRPRTIQRLRLGADSEGRLLALTHDGLTSMSHPALGEFSEPVGLQSEMLYSSANNAVTHRLVAPNAPLPNYMPASGEASCGVAPAIAAGQLAAALETGPLALAPGQQSRS